MRNWPQLRPIAIIASLVVTFSACRGGGSNGAGEEGSGTPKGLKTTYNVTMSKQTRLVEAEV